MLVFTEQGVAMLSGLLRSERAVAVNIEIMRAFVEVRRLSGSFEELRKRVDQMDLDIGTWAGRNLTHLRHRGPVRQRFDPRKVPAWLSPISRDVEGFAVTPEEFIAAGDAVAVVVRHSPCQGDLGPSGSERRRS